MGSRKPHAEGMPASSTPASNLPLFPANSERECERSEPIPAPADDHVGLCDLCHPGRTFLHHRDAALALLLSVEGLTFKQGGFLGHVVVSEALTAKQQDWLDKLLARYGLPPMAS